MEVKAAAKRANELLGRVGTLRRTRNQKQARLDAGVKRLKDRYGPEIDKLKQEEDELVDELIELVVPKFMLLVAKRTKTIKLRNGEIKLRSSRDVLELEDGPKSEAAVIQRIARKGGLRRYTRLGKRTLDKEALKKNPRFVASIKGIKIVRRTRIIIVPSRAQGVEIERDSDALSTQLLPEGD